MIGRLEWIRVLEVHLPLPAPGFGLCRADGDSGRFHRQADRSQERLLRDSGDRSVGRTRGGRRFQTLESRAGAPRAGSFQKR